MDAGTGYYLYIDGSGAWKRLIGKKCNYAISYLGDAFIGMGKRLKGSDMDRAVGKTTLIDGKGFWKDYIGYKCSYAIEYVEDIVFAPVKCKK